ncbi:hypothetical protein PUN28_016655 [Cardiocondyla obscurior]
MDKEVVSCLLSCGFSKIAKNILTTSDEPRLTERVLGIIGNVCCSDEAIDTICCDKELVTQILNHLGSDDSLTLIQLIRILQLIVWKIQQNPQSDWVAHLTECEFFGDSITFMLKSSTNDDLLISAMNLLSSISEIKLPNENSFLEKLFKLDCLIPALLESFVQVTSKNKTNNSEWSFAQHWLTVLIAIMELGSLKFEDDYENDERFSKLMEIMYQILKPCKKSHNLYPIDKLGANMIYDAVRILLCFQSSDVSIPPRINSIIAFIIFSLKTVPELDSREDLDPEELTIDLLNYLNKYWLQVVAFCTSQQLIEIFHLCDREVRENLINFVRSDCKATPETLDKIKEAAVAFEK